MSSTDVLLLVPFVEQRAAIRLLLLRWQILPRFHDGCHHLIMRKREWKLEKEQIGALSALLIFRNWITTSWKSHLRNCTQCIECEVLKTDWAQQFQSGPLTRNFNCIFCLHWTGDSVDEDRNKEEGDGDDMQQHSQLVFVCVVFHKKKSFE